MSFVFSQKPNVLAWAKRADNGSFLSIDGVNPNSSPDNAVSQINKLLALGGLSVVPDNLSFISQKEAKNNG